MYSSEETLGIANLYEESFSIGILSIKNNEMNLFSHRCFQETHFSTIYINSFGRFVMLLIFAG